MLAVYSRRFVLIGTPRRFVLIDTARIYVLIGTTRKFVLTYMRVLTQFKKYMPIPVATSLRVGF